MLGSFPMKIAMSISMPLFGADVTAGMPGGMPPDLNFFATGDLSVQLKDLEKSLGAHCKVSLKMKELVSFDFNEQNICSTKVRLIETVSFRNSMK